QYFDGALFNRLRQRRQLRRRSGRWESHILCPTCIGVLVGSDQEIILVPRDARVEEHVRGGEDFRRQSGEEVTVFVGPLRGHHDAHRRPPVGLQSCDGGLQRRLPATLL